MPRRAIPFPALLALPLLLAGCSMLPGDRQAPSADVPQAGTLAARQCLSALSDTGTRFEVLPDREYGGGCSTVNSVSLDRLPGDFSPIAVSSLGPVVCEEATAFAKWARFGVDRAARQHLGTGVARIETMGSYSCRNVAGTGRRSAHATAQAIDVSGFVLADGRRISVAGDWDSGTAAERAFLRTVHRSACKRFGTVLGPDYNAAHRDHFHVEKIGGGRTFCR
ncbi:extensin family protein [Paraurantiacibacter namhicola]|uniref:Extensin-like C-terminal domain-containing protein n=1 Tax=Paraurantiacibacter namhicola TaxID=645517 RepID=A0A1C7D7P7_9SPHN|nr:extensin family protein [Paraurantiacibacter namhicola]ANU07382.1 hypothetical protein A6F65_01073 [Paraurantiacibacter namhicola]